jgi:hypothetical protein
MEYSGGREQPNAPECEKGVSTPSLPVQEPVDHPEQEREQRSGVVGRSHRMAVRRTLLVLMGQMLCHEVFGEHGVRELV